MQTLFINEKHNKILEVPTGVGLGNFDGLHIGHMALINTLIKESELNQLKSVVYTFTMHPQHILRKKLYTPLLTSAVRKIELLSETPLDYLCFEEFDENYSRMKPEAFVKNVLVERLHIKLVVTGFNYRFGYQGSGDTLLLQKLGREHGFKVIIIPPIKIQNEVASSTVIREYLVKGHVHKVFRLLGRHYSMMGTVETGRQMGTQLGFPTANIQAELDIMVPEHGVYATKTYVEDKLYDSVTSIGTNPTITTEKITTIETHILDFQQDIYHKNVEVFFIERIRGEKTFKNVEELKKNIAKDIIKCREILEME